MNHFWGGGANLDNYHADNDINVVMVRGRCQCGLGCVNATCDKSDNRLHILKTSYQSETGLPAYRLPDNIPSYTQSSYLVAG